jgi:hypothetical protein
MHLENGLLYALLVLVAWGLYRELLPGQPALAALAALMFAIDDGHATAAGWIACRSMLLSSLLALASVLAFVRSRASPRSALLRLSAGQIAVARGRRIGPRRARLSGRVRAHVRARSLVRRVARLLPESACSQALIYLSGTTACVASAFTAPSSPLSTLAEGVMDLPAWLFLLLGPNLLDAHDAGARRCMQPRRCFAPLLAALYTALPRTREVRFFALGALFCLPMLPPCRRTDCWSWRASVPSASWPAS